MKTGLLVFLFAALVASDTQEVGIFDDDRNMLSRNSPTGGGDSSSWDFVDLKTITFEGDGAFVPDAMITTGQIKPYRASYASDVTELVMGVEWRENPYGDVRLWANIRDPELPNLPDNIENDYACRKEKEQSESAVCNIIVSGGGTLYLWLEGLNDTVHNYYARQRRGDDIDG